MAYYVRILTPLDEPVACQSIQAAVERHGASLRSHDLSTKWTELRVIDKAGDILCVIERNEVQEGSFAREELQEFEEEIADCLPKSASDWLTRYLGSVRAIYAIQILHAGFADDAFEIVDAARSAIWKASGGVIQADGEGFSNEGGDHILWQFSDGVDGSCWMAILKDGSWRRFLMDLGNPQHRVAFQAGQIPDGIAPQ